MVFTIIQRNCIWDNIFFYFNFDNNIHECPYNSVQEMFDFNQVLSRV